MRSLALILCLFIFSCSQKECINPINGKAILVAYRVAKHSHLWLKDIKTNNIYDVGNIGGRREPNINLGDTINVKYCDGEILFDIYSYIRIPSNRETRFIPLKGYENIN